MKIYGLKNCDKCRLASKTLLNSGQEVSFIDVRSDGISLVLLENFYSIFGVELVNKRSTTWRSLSLSEQKQDPIELLIKYPALMKRPIISYNDKFELGWNKEVENRILN
ncbi:arsenate reductase [Amylibacter sp.]|nr:arsenate reductase [Amylibacter sp.]